MLTPLRASVVPSFHVRLASVIGMVMLVGMISVSSLSRADIKLSLDVKDGDKISDVANIVAHATSGDNIDKVEFVVDDQLKFTATGVPYKFAWDTIPDTEGKHALIVTAYDGNGGTKKLSISLMIDNDLSLGTEALAAKAEAALKANDTDAAMRWARRALKADPDNVAGAQVVARISAQSGDLDKAISTLEKAKGIDENYSAVMQLIGYKTKHAWMPENAGTFFTELDAIDSLRRKAAALDIAAVTKANASAGISDSVAGHIALGDALMRAGRLVDATVEYAKAGTGDDAPVTSIARLALAYALHEDTVEASRLIRQVQVAKKDDPAIRAVGALIMLRTHRFAEARALVRPDLSTGYGAAFIVAAYADAVLLKPAQAYAEAQAGRSLLPDSGDVQYALSMTTPRLNDQEDALQAAISRSPFSPGPYLDLGARRSLQDYQDRYDRGQKFAQFVLKTDPGNLSARILTALLDIQTRQLPLAEPILNDLLRKYKSEPDVMETVSVYFDQKGNPTYANQYNSAARKLDEDRFNFGVTPAPMELLQLLYRKYRYRAEFFLSPSSLYPPKATAVSSR